MKSTAPLPLMPAGARQQSLALVFFAGAIIGVLGGMIGLGGAEFRLPLLIGVSGFAALQAIIMNKAMSLLLIITALPARPVAVPIGELSPYWIIVLNLLAGIITGGVAALMGVADGELRISTIVMLYGTDIKIAGSLSLAVSLPTMLVASARFSRDKSFAVLGQNKRFLHAMTLGSITGTVLGGLLLGTWFQAWSLSRCSSCSCSCPRSEPGTITRHATGHCSLGQECFLVGRRLEEPPSP